MKNLNTVFYTESGTITNKTNNNIFAYAESQNVIRVYTPLSDFTFLGKFGKYAVVQGEKKVLLPERLYMIPKGQETVEGVLYNVYEQIVPSVVLSKAFVGQDALIGFQLEAYRIVSDKYLGIKFYQTSSVQTIVNNLAQDFPEAEEDDFVRIIDTDTDWVFDGTTWTDTEQKLALGLERRQHAVIDYVVQGSFETDAPSHKPENTEFILTALDSKAPLNAFLDALDDIQALQTGKLETDGSNAETDIEIRNVTFNLGVDTDAIQDTDFAAYADGGSSNLADFFAYIEAELVAIDANNFYTKAAADAIFAPLGHVTDTSNPHQTTAAQVGAYTTGQADTLLAGKANVAHVTDFNNPHQVTAAQVDAYTKGQSDEEFMAKDDYLDANDKILLDKLPDVTKGTTTVQLSTDPRPANPLAGDKLYETDTGDTFIYNGNDWVILAEADWENVNLDWANIDNAPKSAAGGTLKDGNVYTVTEADDTFAALGHTHVEADITNLDKYTQAQTDTLLNGKANTGHTHVEADVTDLDKYTQNEVDVLLADKVDVGVLSSNIILYATSTTADVGIYNRAVSSITDADYDEPAVDIVTPQVTGIKVPVGAIIADPNLFVGNPGVINVPIVGNVKANANNLSAQFYFEVYLRDDQGVETLLGESDKTTPVTLQDYREFNASALLNNGEFTATDRLVFKFFADKVSGPNGTFSFQYGGATPVRVLLNVPIAVTLQAERFAYDNTVSGLDAENVQAAIDEVSDNIDTHIDDTDNPHQTTAAQVGSYTEAQVDTLLNGKANASHTHAISEITNLQTELNDIDTRLNAVQGAYVLRGTITQTSAAIDADKTLLTARIDTLLERTPNLGDVLKDSDGGEWYYDGAEWRFMGQAIIDLDQYYTKTESDNTFASVSHTHVEANITDLDKYTQAQVDNLLDDKADAIDLTNHINDSNNPHQTTATQVGLGSVLNYGIASQAEAEAGSTNEKYMTPLRVAQAIAELGVNITSSATAPADPKVGDLWFDATSLDLFIWYFDGDSAQWVGIGADSGSVTWESILNKPTEFAPEAHTHVSADITDPDNIFIESEGQGEVQPETETFNVTIEPNDWEDFFGFQWRYPLTNTEDYYGWTTEGGPTLLSGTLPGNLSFTIGFDGNLVLVSDSATQPNETVQAFLEGKNFPTSVVQYIFENVDTSQAVFEGGSWRLVIATLPDAVPNLFVIGSDFFNEQGTNWSNVSIFPIGPNGEARVQFNGLNEQTPPTGTADFLFEVAEFDDLPSAEAVYRAVVSINGRKGIVTLDKTDVGLANVTNALQVTAAEKGQPNGVATLDNNGKVPIGQLPALAAGEGNVTTVQESTDPRPSEPSVGDKLFETDTGNTLIYDGSGTPEPETENFSVTIESNEWQDYFGFAWSYDITQTNDYFGFEVLTGPTVVSGSLPDTFGLGKSFNGNLQFVTDTDVQPTETVTIEFTGKNLPTQQVQYQQLNVDYSQAVYDDENFGAWVLLLGNFPDAVPDIGIGVGRNNEQGTNFDFTFTSLDQNNNNLFIAFGGGQVDEQTGPTGTGDVFWVINEFVATGNGDGWVTLARADWENINLDWNNIVNKPAEFTAAAHTHDATEIVSGQFNADRIPNLSANKITSDTLNVARIPDLDAAKIITGTLALARGGTNRDDGRSTGVIETRANASLQFWAGTQAQYDNIVTPDANTIYLIEEV